MSKLICMDPEENFYKECDRNNNRCCMCTSPRIAVPLDLIKQLIETLETDGINSKKVAKDVLKDIVYEHTSNT